jgi:hypothetical protein
MVEVPQTVQAIRQLWRGEVVSNPFYAMRAGEATCYLRRSARMQSLMTFYQLGHAAQRRISGQVE